MQTEDAPHTITVTSRQAAILVSGVMANCFVWRGKPRAAEFIKENEELREALLAQTIGVEHGLRLVKELVPHD